MKYKEYKIKIGDNPSLSEAVQKKAFELGEGWSSGGKKVQLTNFHYLFFKKNGALKCGMGKADFKGQKAQKISIRDFFKLTKEDVIVKPETIPCVFYADLRNGDGYTLYTPEAVNLTEAEADDIVHMMRKMVQERES
mgnify:CR=1 FL=1